MIIFITNYLNHHQYPVAAELFKLTGGNYRFVEMLPVTKELSLGGYPDYDKPTWLIRAWENSNEMNIAYRLSQSADVMLYGGVYPYEWIKQRLYNGKLTFEIGERWLKRGIFNLFSPRLIKNQYYYHRYFYDKPLYRLNIGAHTAFDIHLLHAFKGKCYKWGYFTKVDTVSKEELHSYRHKNKLRIMWCARFLKWKHPENVVRLAKSLKEEGTDFEIEMYGSGPIHEKIRHSIEKEKLTDVVFLKGNMSNEQIRQKMREAHIFLFTSDKNEGWGAVINEALSVGCCVVASSDTGSVPMLIESGINGISFPYNDTAAMIRHIKKLACNRNRLFELGSKGYLNLAKCWTPSIAADRLLTLINALRSDNKTPFSSGICSSDF